MLLFYGNRGLQVRVSINYSAADIFAMAHGGIRFNSNGAGNGDRCPETGVFDTATGSAKVRQPALPVNATVSDPTGSRLTSWRFQTIGDQFRIQVGYRNAIRVSDMGFQGRLELDTDRRLQTGLVQTPFLINSPFNEIPTWGWDVAIQFQGGTDPPVIQHHFSLILGNSPTSSNHHAAMPIPMDFLSENPTTMDVGESYPVIN